MASSPVWGSSQELSFDWPADELQKHKANKTTSKAIGQNEVQQVLFQTCGPSWASIKNPAECFLSELIYLGNPQTSCTHKNTHLK